jgi:hypothetical protein
MYSHPALYADKGIHSNKTTNYASPKFNLHRRFKRRRDVESAPSDARPLLLSELPLVGSNLSATLKPPSAEQVVQPQPHVESEEQVPQMNKRMSVLLLILVTVVC